MTEAKAKATVPVRNTSGSLERRLTLTISLLLATTIMVFGVLAYQQVKRSSIASATEQLRTVVGQAVDNANRGTVVRLQALGAMANSPIVTPAFVKADTAPVRALLLSRRAPADSGLITQALVREDASEVLLVGEPSTGQSLDVLRKTIARSLRTDSVVVSPFFAVGDQIRYWTVAPSHAAKEKTGFLAELRRLRASPLLERQIQDLTGQEISVYYAANTGDVWSGPSAQPISPSFDARVLPDSFFVTTDAGERVFGVKGSVAGTPWEIIFTMSEAAVSKRAMNFVQSMFMLGLAVLVLGMIVARWVSRLVTSPIRSLKLAADAIADGDFDQRVSIRSSDEIEQLAETFNAMSERIGYSHRQLASRMLDLQRLTNELRERNAELQEAQQTAMEAQGVSEKAREDALRASKAKTDFLAMMSHELRTPLSAISGYAEILQMGMRGELNEAQKADLGRIQSNQSHLLRIINDILDLAQVESGQIYIECQPVKLGDSLADLEPIVLPLIKAQNIEYQVDPNAHDLRIHADRERLTQVLVNLVANAVRFTSAGGAVKVHAQSLNGRVLIHVADTGVGISDDKQQVVFEPFVRLDHGATRRAQGTGLGLAISRRIIEAMNGKLTVRSELGVGSTFTVELDVSAGVPEAQPQSDFALQSSGHQFSPRAE